MCRICKRLVMQHEALSHQLNGPWEKATVGPTHTFQELAQVVLQTVDTDLKAKDEGLDCRFLYSQSKTLKSQGRDPRREKNANDDRGTC